MCLGFELGTTGWKAQMNSLNYGGPIVFREQVFMNLFKFCNFLIAYCAKYVRYVIFYQLGNECLGLINNFNFKNISLFANLN